MQVSDEEHQDASSFRHISEVLPAMELVTKTYSLEPDMLSGWKPRMRIVGPVPLNFDNPIVDTIVEELTSYGKHHTERVIFLGNRPASSFKLHQQLKHDYQFKYAHLYTANYSHLAAFFRKFHSNFQSKQRTRLFRGMNPTVDLNEQFLFESNFQGGNLDSVVKVGVNQYDLFMRIDANTRGHLQWFNFTVKNHKQKKIKINICNFRKEKTLYHRGMRPFICSKYLKETRGVDWVQGGNNVKFDRQTLRYPWLEDQGFTRENLTFNCLQFQYVFERDNDEVGFAYCPPYSYSDLLAFIRTLTNKDKKQEYIKEGVLCQSLSGLNIPLLTITDFSIPDTQKKCIIVSGRIHPGQSNGSYLVQGFLDHVCGDTKQAQEIRSRLVIKAVPMLNPDGVIVGNYRTSLCGRDLNRAFKASVDILFPEVRFLKQLAVKMKQQFRNRLLVFLDFHGHSVKKNVFIYGPQYGICESNYYKTRILPKIISNRTEMFRYYSCMFRIASFKRTTARAVILRNVPHCYTVEASNAFYYSSVEKKDINFTCPVFAEMGSIIADSLREYVDLLLAEEALQAEKRRRLKEFKLLKKRKGKEPHPHQQKQQLTKYMSTDKYVRENPNNRKLRLSSVNSVQQPLSTTALQLQLSQLPLRTRQLINEIRRDQQPKPQEPQQGHESDNFSEGGSDSESGDDLEQPELDKLHGSIMDVLEEFKAKFFHKKMSEVRSRKEVSEKKSREKQQRKEIQMVPSLRKKALEAVELEDATKNSVSDIKESKDKKNSVQKVEVFNWPRIRQDFLIRTSNLKSGSKSFAKAQQLGNMMVGSHLLNNSNILSHK